MLPYLKKVFFADVMKLRVLRWLSLIIRLGPQCHCAYPCKRKEKVGLTHAQRRRPHGGGSRGWRDAAAIQGMLAPTRNWKRQRRGSPSEPPEKVVPCQHLDFRLTVLIWDFWPLETWKNTFLSFYATQLVVCCYGSPGKWMHLLFPWILEVP